MFDESGPQILINDEDIPINIEEKIKDHICCLMCCLAIIITFCVGIVEMFNATLDYFIKN